jgi:hypothetical protein
MRLLPKLLSFAILATFAACISKGDINVDKGEAPPTCNSACEHLAAETFGSCKKWVNYDDCVGECEDHKPTETGLSCVLHATDCPAFQSCDSTHDVF